MRSALAGWLLAAGLATAQTPGGPQASPRANAAGGATLGFRETLPEPAELHPAAKAPAPATAPRYAGWWGDACEPPCQPPCRPPQMIGSAAGAFAAVSIAVPVTARITISLPENPRLELPAASLTTDVAGNFTAGTYIPYGGRGDLRIGDNASPFPEDRVFFTYQFDDALRGPGAASAPRTAVQPFVIAPELLFPELDVAYVRGIFPNGITVPAVFQVPGVPGPEFDYHRETFGLEKTFLDGRASLGLKIPFFQLHGTEPFEDARLGDATVYLKYALYLDPAGGDVLSCGLAVTAPTGPDVLTVAGNIHPTVLQPFVGFCWGGDRLFLQGFSSAAVPTDDRDVTLLFNDLGVGYWLYRGDAGRLVRDVVPVLEAHVTTPLERRVAGAPIVATDLVVLTGGLHLGLGRSSRLTLGVGVPVTGPRLFDLEATAQFNYLF